LLQPVTLIMPSLSSSQLNKVFVSLAISPLLSSPLSSLLSPLSSPLCLTPFHCSIIFRADEEANTRSAPSQPASLSIHNLFRLQILYVARALNLKRYFAEDCSPSLPIPGDSQQTIVFLQFNDFCWRLMFCCCYCF
jgi:hypothetical protein